MSAGICAALYFTIHGEEATWWRHPYPYQSFAVILGFIIIFRCVEEELGGEAGRSCADRRQSSSCSVDASLVTTPAMLAWGPTSSELEHGEEHCLDRRTNYGYQRFWEGRSFLQKMTACWVDACVQVCLSHS